MDSSRAYFAKLKPLKDTQVVRKILFARDSYLCSFCSIPLRYSDATVDHSTPKIRYRENGWPLGDCSRWTNMSAACYPCNQRKSGRTPEEAGMVLLVPLIIPTFIRLDHHGRLYKVQTVFVAQFYYRDSATGELVKMDNHP